MSEKTLRYKKGFTLIELLVVIAIIGTLTALTVGIASVAMNKSNVSNTRADLQLLADVLEEYRIQYGVYPITSGTLDDNDFDFMREFFTNELGKALSDFPAIDRWSRGYYYTNVSPYVYRLYSFGPSTTDPDDDIDVTAKSY